MQKIKKERMTKVLGYLVILFYALYLAVLFAERTVAVVMGFTADEPFCLRGDIAQWYAHIATVFALVSSLVTAIALNGYVFRYLFTRSEADKARIDHGNMAITAGLLLLPALAGAEHTFWAETIADVISACVTSAFFLWLFPKALRRREEAVRQWGQSPP